MSNSDGARRGPASTRPMRGAAVDGVAAYLPDDDADVYDITDSAIGADAMVAEARPRDAAVTAGAQSNSDPHQLW
ncbi:hypothetical protein GCM10027598_60590 [Amycolatopsis oliviviridis]|uniref:Uncharacterized protein n=1 Tax=Amycolatopsis oliviviridis TaxID=1471590 RepID=A0ABQ3M3D7_9PSEU|nr:hypothetical protein GCM10017790_68890 [Amycolatopsis oliviviridis]